ncbi:MAG: hypothetical protein OXM55_02590 [Bdellovibrionales bacterium]|nr:hypothetical protein [Bdellovibrionales bacterium]
MKNILFFMFIIVSSFNVYARGENDGSGVVKRSQPVTDSTTTGTLPSPSPVSNYERSQPVKCPKKIREGGPIKINIELECSSYNK